MQMMSLAAAVVLLPVIAAGQDIGDMTPEIDLFESMETVREYLEGETEEDYDDLFLSSVTLVWTESHPRQGRAWHYSFMPGTPTLGGGVSIFHYMDGEILEHRQGP